MLLHALPIPKSHSPPCRQEIANDFIRLGFLRPGTDVSEIVPAMETIWAASWCFEGFQLEEKIGVSVVSVVLVYCIINIPS